MASFAIERAFCWPEGHWDWYRHLAFKHGVRCGELIFVGGQVDKTSAGEPLHVGDLQAQTAAVVAHLATVLAGFGATLADVTRLTAFYATDGSVREEDFIADVGRHVTALGGAPDGVGSAIVAVPLPWLALPGMRVEIEAIAMPGGAGARRERRTTTLGPALPPPFVHGVRCGAHVFIGGQAVSAGTGSAFAALTSALAALDAGADDLVRAGLWHRGSLDAALASHLDALQCASVVLPTPRLPAALAARVDGWAMTGPCLERRASNAPADWSWPGRRGRTKAVGCGALVFVSGQLALDARGAALHAGDLNAQTRLCMERTRAALAAFGLDLDHMVRQNSFYLGAADPKDIVANQTLRSSFYCEPAGASTGVPLTDFGIPGVMVSVDTVAMT